MDLTELKAAVMRFRSVVETNRDCLPGHLGDFPAGCCSDISDLLATYLAEEGFGDFKLMSHERDSNDNAGITTHAWLQNGSLIIDITGDQFSDFQQPVFVGRTSGWHKGFRPIGQRPAGLAWIDGPIRPSLDKTYLCLRRFLFSPDQR